jgi:hypothetical protein
MGNYSTSLKETVSLDDLSDVIAGSASANSGLYFDGTDWRETRRAWAIGETAADGIILENTTAATVGADQYSPSLTLSGRGWDTGASASQDVSWRIYNVAGAHASSPTGRINFDFSVDGGAYANKAYLTSGAQFTATTVTASSQVASNGAALRRADLNTGLGNAACIQNTYDNPAGIVNSGLTDAANARACFACYDVNAATCASKIFSAGFTTNADAYTEKFYVQGDGCTWISDALRITGTATSLGGGVAGELSIANEFVANGAVPATLSNVPAAAAGAASNKWFLWYDGVTAMYVPVWI